MRHTLGSNKHKTILVNGYYSHFLMYHLQRMNMLEHTYTGSLWLLLPLSFTLDDQIINCLHQSFISVVPYQHTRTQSNLAQKMFLLVVLTCYKMLSRALSLHPVVQMRSNRFFQAGELYFLKNLFRLSELAATVSVVALRLDVFSSFKSPESSVGYAKTGFIFFNY